MTADRTMCSRSRNTTTPTTAYVLIGSTESAKSRTRFSLSSAAARWRSRGATTNRVELSVAANLATDLEASRERLATCCQPHGNREGPTCLSVGIGRRESRPSSWRRRGVFSPTVVFAKDRLSDLVFDIRPLHPLRQGLE